MSQTLDLTCKQTLFELAIEEEELRGHRGAKLIAEMRERAAEADYTHFYYRDPIRPGITWLLVLTAPIETESGGFAATRPPVRGKLEEARRVTEKVFPGFLAGLSEDSEQNIMSQIPPLALGVSGLDLAIALEYIVFAYPGMVRAWATLVFAYNEILALPDGAESVRNECLASCPHAQVVAYLISETESEDGPPEEPSIS